ncbi:MAG: hypothetical protein AABZ53_13360, partial [Planctomycetota bacterium]
VAGMLTTTICARADIVYLSDGTWIKGTILKETDSDVEIDGKTNSGIAVRTTISKGRIASVIRSETPAADPAKPDPAKPDASKPDATKPDAPKEKEKEKFVGDFVVIPLEGTFGVDIYPKGVELALDQAIHKGIKHVVFKLDSGGGQVWAADTIAKMMKDRESKLKYHAVVKKAISATIWVVVGCNSVAATPGSTLGGAVMFTENGDTGAKEVDGKFNSIIAAELSASAEARGFSAELVRSMMLPDRKLIAYKKVGKDSAGKPVDVWTLAESLPADLPPDTVTDNLSDGHRVVTLTSEQMYKYGVAKRLAKDSEEELATLVGDPKFKSAGDFGAQSMKQALGASRAFTDQLNAWAKGVVTADNDMNKAVAADDVDLAIGAVDRFLTQLKRVGSLRNRAKELGLLSYPALKNIDVETGVKKGEELLIKLKKAKREQGRR